MRDIGKSVRRLFISHSSQDDAFVRELRMALADHAELRVILGAS